MRALFLLPFVALLPLIAAEPKAEPKPFEKELLAAAGEYAKWGRVDDEVRWAPELCRIPYPAKARISASEDETTHGQKLYSLFAAQRHDYVRGQSKVGQMIVKQSWVPEEITEEKDKPLKPSQTVLRGTADDKRPDPVIVNGTDHFYPYAWKGDKVYKAAKQGELFIMMKLDPKTEGTDEGWVYGTVSADGKQVTASGKIESCMKCHAEAKNDRLFGLK